MTITQQPINWAEEQALIYSKLEVIPRFSGSPNTLGTIMEHISGSGMAIDYTHPHVELALDLLKGYPFPFSMQDYQENFRPREWDYVCESLLAARRLKLLEPNEFQRFMLGLYIWEYQPACCCACGLTPGIWCGEYQPFFSARESGIESLIRW